MTPIEQVTSICGKRKIQRANINSIKSYNDIKSGGNLDSLLLLPVLLSNVEDFMGRLDEDMRSTLDGVMLFGDRNIMGIAS